jgi:high affinity Mn2+ porin
MQNFIRQFLRLILAALAILSIASSAVRAAEEVPEQEDWTARFQASYIMQKKPGFAAAYSGQNSLSTSREQSYTLSTTAHLGVRAWAGGELYFDPEMTVGVPLSNLTGLGGYYNGEITRAAGTNPTFYRQRLFLRQTWNLGGASQHLDAGLNQMAGFVDQNRIVLTVGNFSTLDVFDGNAYAKDPRTQFMNWGNMTYAAYDYAADARGFGWGFAAEWYRDDGWAFRFGRMTGPREPNGLPVDQAIGKHYGDQFEIERAHELGGQPGKVRLLGWRNRAVTASFSDALAYLQANPGSDPQTIMKVRNGEKIKYGVGINIEQAINENLGVFLRAMKADGRTETYAFTEVDGSLSVGASLKGAAWARSEDTVGLAFLRNTLSKERRDYLAAGGISFFIGDGALNYRPEQIVEAYYSLELMKDTSLSLNVQHFNNPAYNADRGPVNIIGARFHTEF